MNDLSLHEGRFRQKLQTRTEILAAANRLLHQQKKITLEDVSKEAGISRATVYRYFSRIDLLITEASREIHHKSPYQLFENVKHLPVEDRVFYIQRHYNSQAQDHEPVLRRYLSAVLTETVSSGKNIREDERFKTLAKVLIPFKSELGEDVLNKLIAASTILMGIDSLIVCKDVCEMQNSEADIVLRWALDMILKGIAVERTRD